MALDSGTTELKLLVIILNQPLLASETSKPSILQRLNKFKPTPVSQEIGKLNSFSEWDGAGHQALPFFATQSQGH